MPKTLLLLVAAICAVMPFSAGPKVCLAAERPSAEQRIEEELEQPTELEFIETPLQDVVDYLKKHHRIEIQIDRKALDDVGLDPSITRITKHLKGLSLGSTLRLLLRDMDLTYLVEDEALLITTPEEAESRLTTRLYPVADLVNSADKEEEKRRRNELVHAITTNIQEGSWYSVGGPGTITTTSFHRVPTLVVSQTYHVHRKIAAFLQEQRRVIRAGRQAAVPRCRVLDLVSPAVKRIEKVLMQPTEFSFTEEPLQDVVDYLKGKHSIEIQIDREALDDVGLDASETPVTRSAKGISLRWGLRLLLRDLDLTYLIEDGVVLITSEEAEMRLRTKIYAVGDLLGSSGFPGKTGQRSPGGMGMGGMGMFSVKAEPAEDTESPPESESDLSAGSAPGPPHGCCSGETLIKLITAIIDPCSWDQVGGPGSIAGASFQGVDMLVVSNTEEAHEQIALLLEKLREFVRCNQSPAAPAPKPAAGKPTTDEPPKAPPLPEPPDDEPDDAKPAEKPAAEPADDPFGD